MPDSETSTKIEEVVQQDLERVVSHVDLNELHNSSLFVTGCTGFFGYWLLMAIKNLNRQGANIRVWALSRQPETFLSRHPQFRQVDWLRMVAGDVATFELLDERFDYCIHGATDTRPERLTDQLSLMGSAFLGTQRVCMQAKKSAVKALLLISSGAVYGQQAIADCPGKLKQQNGYAAAKKTMEQLALLNSINDGYQLKIARCFAFIGYLLPQHLAISQFIHDSLHRNIIKLEGDGTPVRSYLYAADLAVWLLVILIHGKDQTAYDVGSDDAKTLFEHAQTVARILAPDKPVELGKVPEPASGDRPIYMPDIRLATEDLGLKVWTSLDSAIKQTGQIQKWINTTRAAVN